MPGSEHRRFEPYYLKTSKKHAMEWEIYGLTEGEWNALTDEERESYRSIGSEENMSDATEFEAEEPEVEVVAEEI